MDPENKQKRARCEYKGVSMSYFRMERIRQLAPMIQRANEQRMTIPQAAKWLGWSTSALRNWLRILGIHWHKRPDRKVYRFDKDGWGEKIKAMREAGETIPKIAVALGVGPWNISRYVRDHGLQSKSRKSRPNE